MIQNYFSYHWVLRDIDHVGFFCHSTMRVSLLCQAICEMDNFEAAVLYTLLLQITVIYLMGFFFCLLCCNLRQSLLVLVFINHTFANNCHIFNVYIQCFILLLCFRVCFFSIIHFWFLIYFLMNWVIYLTLNVHCVKLGDVLSPINTFQYIYQWNCQWLWKRNMWFCTSKQS